MDLDGVIDDHVLQRYRVLLDAEDEAFDALEHACEDGDRVHWESELASWQRALDKKIAYLQRLGVELPVAATA